MVLPILMLSCLICLLVLFLFCAFSLSAVVLHKHRDKILNKSKVPKTLKQTMMKKSCLVLVTIFMSLLSVVTAECMLIAGPEIDDIALISVTLSIMSLSKVCNPLIYTLYTTWLKSTCHKSLRNKLLLVL